MVPCATIVSRRASTRVVRRLGRGPAGGGDLEVAVANQGVPVLDAEQLARETGGVDHAVHSGGGLLPHARGLNPGMAPDRHPGRWAASVRRRTDIESSWA
jgi:hypothetical protein